MSKVLELFDSYEEGGGSRPYVEERSGIVRLRFNAFDIQSEMRKSDPEELILRYTRTMAEGLSLVPDLKHIGMIGLGGGSLQKYCYRTFPTAFISVAEINPAVIEMRDLFRIPEDDHRFVVYCEDGADFVRRYRDEFDVLMVDGFDKRGQPRELCSSLFYHNCYRSLRANGLLIANLCAEDHLIPRIRREFRNQVIAKDCEGHYNTVVFAGKGTVLEEEGLQGK